MDGASRLEGRQRVRKEIHRGMGQVQDDAVERSGLPQDDSRVPVAHLDAVGPISRYVPPEEVHGDGIGVRGDDPRGLTPSCDQDGEGPDTREGVGHRLAGAYLTSDSQPLAPESGAEVGPCHVHVVPQAELRADGRRPGVSGDDLEIADAEFSHDPAVVGDDPQGVVPFQDSAAELRTMWGERLRDLEDRDVPYDVERGREL
jgi:hypothetical protein